ncbi:Malonyl CoA-acyl carrier protein transacylase [Chondromyces apiculatus DSM 436]|uniref:Malonyl CoA-acyl carrier protein transacylase n=2 Tax=Chondromyces apiculatus TaxID=51 RepID=A0A017SVE4_9BACT|nr:Malonyl CoA-acyl carrier protein transacylase [Chondromyces apiculatus DSM 436]
MMDHAGALAAGAILDPISQIEAWLVAHLASHRGVAPQTIDVRERFSHYGLDSLGATGLLTELSKVLGRPLSPTLVWEYPTLGALARYIAEGTGEPSGAAPARATRGAAGDEPIAIVGMACRFPGAPDVEAFWRLLSGGAEAISEVPADRWGAAVLGDADPGAAAVTSGRGGFIGGIDAFDPQFFSISPREADSMDPQQRLVLELSWEALEDAGVPPYSLRESRTGVFVGAVFDDYALLQDRAGADAITAYTSTGGTSCIIANRVSYALGLMGPSMTIETACSSSLVAVDLACHSLRRGESDVALAGGVNLILLAETTAAMGKLGALSPDGRCKAFDAAANGYVRGEGAGIVVLKRLSDALRDGDRVHCVIRGSAVNNDGPSHGLTAPNPAAQRALLVDACRSAQIDPASVHYVEAHGTGTPLGDPIEASALGAVYGAGRSPERPLHVGSVKTNIGHLESAAGVAGLIKATLAITRGAIPPSLHFQQPNPHIDFEALRLRVTTALVPWPAPEGEPRRAGVSSFGYGGTGAHLVLEGLPRTLARVSAAPGQAGISARQVAWAFSGQGSQWLGMGRDLVLGEPAFRAMLTRCDACMQPYLEFSMFDEILAGAPRAQPERVDVLWPVIFAFQVSLAALWRSLGVEPSVVFGHSIGEIAAAQVAGALTLEDAARVICQEARLVQRIAGKGVMALVALGWRDAEAAVAPYGERLACAIEASPTATVLSGEPGAMAEILAKLGGLGVSCRAVGVGVAGHGPAMGPIAADLRSLLGELRPRAGSIPFVSGMTGAPVRGEDLDGDYWARQLREPVRFGQAVARVLADAGEAPPVFLEIAPHPVVKQSIEECCRGFAPEAPEVPVVASLHRTKGAAQSLSEARGALAQHGVAFRHPQDGGGAASPRAHLLPLSAKGPEALASLVDAYREALLEGDACLGDIAYTAGARRSHHEHRLSVVGARKEDVAAALLAFGRGEGAAGLVAGKAPAGPPKVVFVFPGQGSQWAGMGRQLLAEEPVFRSVVAGCDEAIRRAAGFSVIEVLEAEDCARRLEAIDVVQPVLFAVEVALAALWRAWGVVPDAVVGHSMGEVAAAHVAGALSLEDAAAVICTRSRLLRGVSGLGAMALIELGMADAERTLLGYEDRLSVAVSNGPQSTVIAGDPGALDAVLARLDAQRVFCRRVKVDVASHSPQMNPLRGALLAALHGVAPREAQVPMRSTVTAQPLRGDELSAGYWADNLREPVRFAEVVQRLIAEGHTLFVEMSPHPILVPSVEENLGAVGAEGAAIPSLRRGQPERGTLLEAVGKLYVHGCSLDWQRIHAGGGRVVGLPTYRWQRQRCWLEAPVGPSRRPGSARALDNGGAGHPLLGVAFNSHARPEERTWERCLSLKEAPYLADHRVLGDVVFPATGYVEMALAAGAEALGTKEIVLEDLEFQQMLVLPEATARVAQLALAHRGARRASFQIASRADGAAEWSVHAAGTLRVVEEGEGEGRAPVTALASMVRPGSEQSVATHYERMQERQLVYGPRFQSLAQLWTGDDEALVRVRLPGEVKEAGYLLHPALLDACLQACMWLLGATERTDTYVPVGIRRLVARSLPAREVWARIVRRHEEGARGAERAFDLRLVDDEGQALIDLDGVRLRRLETGAMDDALARCVHEVAWRRVDPLPEVMLTPGGAWLVFTDRGGLGAALGGLLRSKGQRCVLVSTSAGYERCELDRYGIDPANPADYLRLLREAFGDAGPCTGVVHLSTMDAAPFEAMTAESLSSALVRGSVSAAHLVQALVKHAPPAPPRILFVTRGAQRTSPGDLVSVAQAPLLGFAGTLALEHPEFGCTRIDLDPAARGGEAELLCREMRAPGGEGQVALRGGDRYVARLVRGRFEPDASTEGSLPGEPARSRPFQLTIQDPGVLDRMALAAVRPVAPGPGQVVIEVEAAGLNFLDVLLALGAMPDDAPGADGRGPRLGSECAGTVVAVGEGVTDLAVGQEVMALGARAFGSRMVTVSSLVTRRPAHLRWEEAATLPLVFVTAYYALEHVGRLRRGERVLIHAGAGGVGLAAIQWAQHVGAEIFATAGSEEKRAYLRDLGVQHVLDSRSLRFADEVHRITNGEGIDVVLNSLSSEFIPASLGLLRDHGRFLEIGKKDAYEDRRVGLRPFLRSLTFSLVDLRGMMIRRPALVGELLSDVRAMFEAGTLKPLPVEVFPISRALDAFQFMAQARHIGKIALALKDPEVRIAPEGPADVAAIRPDATYLITGGLGGLGLALARWLVDRGARHLALLGRSGPGEEARRAIQAMEGAGARIAVFQVDVSRGVDLAGVTSTLAATMPALRGIVHAAAVLDDRTVLDLSEESFARVFAAKALGAWHLHALSAGLDLDFFVLYSSVMSLLGSPGQGNYTAANALLDALAHRRERMGLPAMSIQWGTFSEVGLAAAQQNRGQRLSERGLSSLAPEEGLAALGRLLRRPRAQVGIARLDVQRWIASHGGSAGSPFWAEVLEAASLAPPGRPEASEIRAEIERAAPEDAIALLTRFLVKEVALVMRLDPSRIEATSRLSRLGFDSLMTLELRNRVQAAIGVQVSSSVLLQHDSIGSVASYLSERLTVRHLLGAVRAQVDEPDGGEDLEILTL